MGTSSEEEGDGRSSEVEPGTGLGRWSGSASPGEVMLTVCALEETMRMALTSVVLLPNPKPHPASRQSQQRDLRQYPASPTGKQSPRNCHREWNLWCPGWDLGQTDAGWERGPEGGPGSALMDRAPGTAVAKGRCQGCQVSGILCTVFATSLSL
ncbi:hypothetical protein H1C71_015443 [Ictidomys tridecemlineatus]|nr:hypothetical protein H1C71_015443 [Ictidomys tridecemlineatus]